MREYFEIASPMDLIEYKRLLETEASQLPDALLVKDIDMTGVPWEPITVGKDKLCSWDFDPFSKSPAAVLDGNGHIITGLRYCPAVKLLKTIVVTLAEGKYTSVQPIGTLFNTSGNINIRSLALRGELFCSGEYRDKEIKQVDASDLNTYKYGFISKSGFNIKDKRDDLILYDLNDLFMDFN